MPFPSTIHQLFCSDNKVLSNFIHVRWNNWDTTKSRIPLIGPVEEKFAGATQNRNAFHNAVLVRISGHLIVEVYFHLWFNVLNFARKAQIIILVTEKGIVFMITHGSSRNM